VVTRKYIVTVFVVLLGVATIASITLLEQHARRSADAELELARLRVELVELQTAPFRADRTARSAERAARQMHDSKERIRIALQDLRRHDPPAELATLAPVMYANFAALDRVYELGSRGGYGAETDRLAIRAGRQSDIIARKLDAAGAEYGRRAARANRRATIGGALSITVLLFAFAFLYRRSANAHRVAQRLAHENHTLLAASREEALTDALTALRNRRALVQDLDAALADACAERQLVLALFDLDGFKQYNDTYGHPAGDALLARLGERLAAAVDGVGTAYRMGGDEFCVLAARTTGLDVVAASAAALAEGGYGFEITASHGAAVAPAEVDTAEEALRLADQRLYEHKNARSSASRQTAGALLRVLRARDDDADRDLSGAASLARLVAEHLGLPAGDVKRIRLAAELHDIGKTAVPDAILNKPGELDEHEWDFVRRHTVIGERIILAGPSLTETAKLVRATHERVDGAGYPDALVGIDIPLGARIIAACDAFDAMVSPRPYRTALTTAEAVAELRRCAGTQFDRVVVEAVVELVEELDAQADAA
jgi:diguanylate cyclase (GGDEF)-like protein